ncbi:unnamed protein product [Plutella xylostella]|uniref:(diamondback moth) hypothetical protein n=1 Tax=Plutella xylostella TaxID=51655 RepID=A0A8S4GBC7_PLUXY|nr:unnamed protein product [Plutella xylostella]
MPCFPSSVTVCHGVFLSTLGVMFYLSLYWLVQDAVTATPLGRRLVVNYSLTRADVTEISHKCKSQPAAASGDTERESPSSSTQLRDHCRSQPRADTRSAHRAISGRYDSRHCYERLRHQGLRLRYATQLVRDRLVIAMPRTARSPPAVSNLLLPGPSTDLTQTSSEPDIPSVIIEPELRKITTRAKRTRGVDLIPGSEFTQFRIEIKEMLSSWKTEQEVTMSKLVKEVSDLKVQNEKIHKTNVDIEKALEFMNGQYEEMRTKIGILENERSLYNDNILRLEMKVEELQNSSKRSIVEFRNIPPERKGNRCRFNVISILSWQGCQC